MRVLLVKTSSMGDLVHALPAITDATRALPQLRFDWLAEGAFAEIPRWHPDVDRVIVCKLRQWRRHPLRTITSGEWRDFRESLRQTEYDLVLDAQGLLKSALLGCQARGPLVGPGWSGARERLATLFYRRRYPLVARDRAHVIERMRRLFSLALDYPLPATPPDAGINPANFAAPAHGRPYVLLLHGTSWETKRWPEDSWTRTGHWLRENGLDPLLPWGSADERATAERIAAAGGGAVLPRQNLTEMAGWLAHARAFVGGDTGLVHIGAALGTPGVTLYGPTPPHIAGATGPRQIHVVTPNASTLDRRRRMDIAPQSVIGALETLLETTQRARNAA